MADERIDYYDVTGKQLGTVMKSEAHAKGIWHKAVHCWILDPERETLLFQLRASTKALYPNCLDISAAGHIATGEKPGVSCVREIEEEIGLTVDPKQLIYLGCNTQVDDQGEIKNREMNETYLLPISFAESEFHLQPEELDGLYEIEIAQAIALFTGQQDEIPCQAVAVANDKELRTKCGRNHFTPFTPHYFLTILIMMERLIEGREPLAIS